MRGTVMTMSIEEISDRLEIQDLFVRYTYALDTQDWDAFDDIFTPDALVDYSAMGGNVGDRAATKQYLRETMVMFPSYQHMTSSSTITVTGDTAEAKTICHNPMVMPLGDEKVQVFYCGLWYVDELVRTDAGWRIKSRVEEKSYVHNMPGMGDS